MDSPSLFLTYFGFTIEFIVPQYGQKWENDIREVFRVYFYGYLPSHLNPKKVDKQIQFTDKKNGLDSLPKSGILLYIVPTTNDSLDEKKFGQLLKEIIITSMLSLTKKRGGVCLHSSSVEYQGKAILFIGDKGAGKSTICQLLTPQFTQLTDDATFIMHKKNWDTSQLPIFEKNIPMIHRSSSGIYEVSALCFVQQSQHNNIIRLRKNTKTFQRLLENSIRTGAPYEIASLRSLFDSRIPIFSIEFEKNKKIAELLTIMID